MNNSSPTLTERNPSGLQLNQKVDKLLDLVKRMLEERHDSKFPEVMTSKDVQEFLQISNQTFYNFKNSGLFKTVDIGGTKRYLKSEIWKMLLEHLN